MGENYQLREMKQCGSTQHMVQENRTIDLGELRVFAAIAHYGGLTSAAAALGVSKSTISHSLTRLEEGLGGRLFERSSRRVALTREGEQMLPRVQSLLAEADNLLEEAARTYTTPRGTVKIAVPPALGSAVLERLVPELQERYPDIVLVVSPNYGMDDLQDPVFDFAIRAGHVHDDSLVANRLGSFSRILVCAPTHPAAKIGSTADLNGLPLLAFSGRAPRVEWRLQSISRPKNEVLIDGQAKFAAQDFDMLVRLARTGHGVAEVPAFMVQTDVRDGKLAHVLPDWRSPPVDVMLAYRVGAARVSRVAAAIEVARDSVVQVLGKSI
ncbi:HTH-type transcriptional regulator DmlR [Ensifer adhaerens]|jgi:DNA-binding transcriptional LysR family regulator|nr:HTH-type transcriptional regulator DmlR [Ensifer adhaerens]